MTDVQRPTPRLWIPCVLLLACGPTIGDSSGGTPDPSTSSPPSTTSSATTGAGPTTTSPNDATSGPLDTVGVDTVGVDTEPPIFDFPEQCSPIEQDCPPGYKCALMGRPREFDWSGAECVPVVPDPNAPGEPCTIEGHPYSGIDDCDATSMCFDVDPKTLEGICRPFCTGDNSDPTCADPCDFCTISADSALTICLPICDPIAQDCPPEEACYPVSSEFVCAPDASPEGAGIGSPCEYINVCPPGQACLGAAAIPGCDTGSAGCCTPFCSVGGADPCPGLLPGTECMPWFEEGTEPPKACVVAIPGVCVAPGA